MAIKDTEQSTALAPIAEPDSFLPTLHKPEELAEVMRANFGGGQFSAFDLPQIRIPTGGGLAWARQTLNGETTEKSVDGVILHWKPARTYYETAFSDSGGGQVPDCASNDGRIGVGNPGGDCATCALAQFGSRTDGRKGSACAPKRIVFIMELGSALPSMLTLPITSVANHKKYSMLLAQRRIPYYGAVTSFTLNREKSGEGISFSTAVPKFIRQLSQEETEQLRIYRDGIIPLLDNVIIDAQAGPSFDDPADGDDGL